MPITPAQKFASSILRRLSDLDKNAETALVIAHRNTIYKIALGVNVKNLTRRLENLKHFNVPPCRRHKYEYDYDYVAKALIISCYKKALGLYTCPNEDKMYLQCMVSLNTIRPAASRPAPKNVIQLIPKKAEQAELQQNIMCELLIC